MMYKTILEFEDANTAVRVGVGINMFDNCLVRITESGRSICLTAKGLADIARAVAQHLEEPFFTEEDLAAGRRAIEELEHV